MPIPAAICERAIEASSRGCSAPTPPPADPLATSFAALATAFTWGTIILAVLAIVAALTWGWLVRGWAEKEARAEAEKCANKLIEKWLNEEAPKIVRQHVTAVTDANLGQGDDGEAADEMGGSAG